MPKETSLPVELKPAAARRKPQQQHTPGPWKVDATYAHVTAIESESNGRIVSLPHHYEDDDGPCGCIESQSKTQEEINSNARLIAAAPDLLAVCESVARSVCLKQFSGDHCICFPCIARPVIAAATTEQGAAE